MAVTRQFDIEFRKDGTVHDPAQAAALLDGLDGLDDLLVLSHGWNNDKADAAALYEAFQASFRDVIDADLVPGLGARRLGLARIFWPSKKFTDRELIPGGGAASATGANDDALMAGLAELKEDPVVLGGHDEDPARRMHVERAAHLVAELDQSAAARKEFVQSIRAILSPDETERDDASAEFFTLDEEELFQHFTGPVSLTVAAGGGGATSLDSGGAAGFLGDMFSGAKAAARRIANFATYYQMKTRAGTVGRTGLGPLLVRVRDRRPGLPLHLIGHSFGGRLVVAAAATLPPGTTGVSLMLLQAAFSHNGLATKFDGKHDGAFRTVLSDRRVQGPVLITHTKNDRAVGVAYPLASRISRDVASALGDENDPYGGIGRNGAQHTPEATPGVLGDLGSAYAFEPGTVHNLRADRFIADHSAVTSPEVAYACGMAIISVDKG